VIDRRAQLAFLILVVVQAAHSIEEVVFKLYAVYAPARLIFGENLGTWFAIANALIVAFGVWCYAARVRIHHPSAVFWMWVWVAVEVVNGTNHTVMAIVRRGYFPGVATAPALLAVSLYLGRRLREDRRD
jgi:uncharacterized protein with HXXEE motif